MPVDPSAQDAAKPGPSHVPVLMGRVLELLAPAVCRPGATVVDGTLGLGGHSEALLRAHPGLHLVGIDRDPRALELAGERLAGFGDRVTLVRAVYDDLPRVLAESGRPRVDGVLLDLGVSSMQLDEAERGFAYAQDAPLDMRMDPEHGRTAADVVNGYSVPQLARVLKTYGEERFALRVAQAISRERQKEPFTRTARLAEVVRTAIPAATRRTGGHPAKRTFQALRIEVNAELTALEGVLPAAVRALTVGGRLVVLSYHSLEDRMVKRVLAPLATSDVPVDLPVVPPGHEPILRLLAKGEGPTEAEVEQNPRAASVRLRAAERVREAA